jgi:hypothetical protein
MRLRARRHAQIWHALTFAVAAGALTLQLVLVVRGHQHLGDSLPEIEAAGRPDLGTRLVRFCSYLTIWFNVMIAGTCARLVVEPLHDGRVWRALRLDAVVIGVGGAIVHWILLRPLLDLHGADYLADKLLHVAVPLMSAVGWLIFGPRNRVNQADLVGFFVVPVAWLGYTLTRGAVTSWYPYPFIDVGRHGYARVGATAVALTALLSGLAAGAMWLDRRLANWPGMETVGRT